MNERVRRFYEQISADESLQAELNELIGVVELGENEQSARKAMAWALEGFAFDHGIVLLAQDLLATEDEGEAAESEPDQAELSSVSGGGECRCLVIGAVKGCGCFLFGGPGLAHTGED